jgi:hypothetical protein
VEFFITLIAASGVPVGRLIDDDGVHAVVLPLFAHTKRPATNLDMFAFCTHMAIAREQILLTNVNGKTK